jgi:Kef-type K+ transport system membrane component KefB
MSRPFLLKYAVLVGAPVLVTVLLLLMGQQDYSTIAGSADVAPPDATRGFQVITLIVQITTVLVVARLFGLVFRKLGQPQVVGEMAAGIFLGPSIFGAIAPAASAYIFPIGSLDYLNALSQVGLLLFMFLIGLEMDARFLRGAKRLAVLTSHTSIVVPFMLGVALAIFFYPSAPPTRSASFMGYALFMGIAVSVTAFPVLARILQERGMTGTRLGALALACAALNDVTAWVLLAVVVVIVRSGAPGASLFWMLGGSIAFAAAMLFVVRPLARRLIDRFFGHGDVDRTLSHDAVALLLVFAMVCAWATERLGIHALFGAFLAGAILPAHYPFVQQLIAKLEDLTVVFLLPLFFAFTGLRTEIGLLASPEYLLKAALIIVVAVAGKLVGTALAARASGMSTRESLSLGALMNTRGLMELVVLNIGLDIGVIPPTLFAMMVIMALVTTLMTTPLLSLIRLRKVAEV